MSSVRTNPSRIRRITLAALIAAAGLLHGRTAVAQAPTSTIGDAELNAPAHISVIERSATIDRDDEVVTGAVGEPLVAGDRLTTDRGRAEIWFADGSTLALDDQSVVELLSDTLIRATTGRLYLTVNRAIGDHRAARSDDSYRVDTSAGSLVIAAAGEYSISLSRPSPGGSDDEADVAVIRGSATFLTDNGSLALRSGERVHVRADGGALYPERFNAARLDDFERWATSQHAPRRTRATSSQYLPADLRMYGSTLDQHGTWEYESAHGYVWYPTVATAWRPYYQGYWRPLPRYGWTWVAADRWGWPTHHYGRWGYGRSRWFWIPDRRWGPAWVSWASAADYVSWCPLGFNNRPVFGFSLSAGSTWAGWVVLPRHSFGLKNAWVSRYAFDGRRIPRSTAFAVHARAPIAPPAFRSRARQGGVDRFDRGDRWRDRDVARGTDRAVPRDGGSRRERIDAGRRPQPGPGGGTIDAGGRASRRFDPTFDDGAGRRSDRFADRTSRGRGDDGWRTAWPDDRPTPRNPRAGIRVDPGVPRAGDRLNPYGDRPRYRTWSQGVPSGQAVPRDSGSRSDASRPRGSLYPPDTVVSPRLNPITPPPNPISPPPNPISPPPSSFAVPRRFGESRSFDGGVSPRGDQPPAGRPFMRDRGGPDGGFGRAVPRGDAGPGHGGDAPRGDDGGGGGRRRGAR